jgi:hypothetical protein
MVSGTCKNRKMEHEGGKKWWSGGGWLKFPSLISSEEEVFA